MELYKNYIIHQRDLVRWSDETKNNFVAQWARADYGEGPFVVENLSNDIATLSYKGTILPEQLNVCYLIPA
jgi:hypothetical protein